MKLLKNETKYYRDIIEKDDKNLYLFIDNCDRTSGSRAIKNSCEYSIRFSKENLRRPTKASNETSVIRGLENACPITLLKQNPLKDTEKKKIFWSDEDFEEFKKIIDDDFEFIQKKCNEKKYENICFPIKGLIGEINSNGTVISLLKTPKLFKYLIKKEIELAKFNPYENNK